MNPYLSLIRTAWSYARQERKRFLVIYALFILSNLLNALNPIFFGWFVNKIQHDKTRVLEYAGFYAAVYIGIKLLQWSLHGPARVMERQLAFSLSRNFLQEMYHQVLHLPIKWHQDHHSGSTINRIRKAYEALKNFFDGGFQYLNALSKFVFSFAAMLYFSPIFGGIGVALGIITVWIIFKFDKPFIKTLEEVNEKEHVVSSTLFDSLSNIITVITLRLEKSMEDGLMSKVKDLLPPLRRNVIINEWKWFSADTLVAVTYAIITVGYVYQNWTPGEVFYVGGLVTLLGYVNQFTSVFHDVAYQYTQVIQYNTDVQTAKDISVTYLNQHRPEAQVAMPDYWHTIDISNLNFTHQENVIQKGQKPPQKLQNINLTIRRGQRIAFIGESGSGKSTLLKVLRGLYEPEPGFEVSINGDIQNEWGTLTNTMTLFPQEPEIFENTIEYNITLGLSFSKEEVWQVCEGAHFASVAKNLPNGLESQIQEKGVNISGGQKQRLALARGILAAQSSHIVLLDEPTSSIDPRTEVKIYENLFKEFSDKAVISSLHRLHLLRYFDYIYVLQNGSIVDEGSFDKLYTSSHVFQEMWRHQESHVATTAMA
ncbi:ABC transporter ATP-binding protein [Cytophagaceae bacterium DM2B3-1]|uniref:ABC transporter ATP-binding protein n=1 Tax=Xanthocytophaga flava TaxID=3048013 RepID=A0ABT7CEU6_9BACT|nr:ABC transporter ATP-binding protein [Xanthocytophaga flavus]MDJ1492268.1 ABC transporter ATP-binding protein [Xanthocytophaga flavus]